MFRLGSLPGTTGRAFALVSECGILAVSHASGRRLFEINLVLRFGNYNDVIHPYFVALFRRVGISGRPGRRALQLPNSISCAPVPRTHSDTIRYSLKHSAECLLLLGHPLVLELEIWSEDEVGSHASTSLKELFEYSNKVDFTLFLTDETPSPPSVPSLVGSPQSLADVEPASDDSIVLVDMYIFDPPDQSTAYDAEHLGDGKRINNLWEDFVL